MNQKNETAQPLWQGRGHIESFGGPSAQLVGNPPEMSFSQRRPDALTVAQQIFDQFEPGHIVASVKELNEPLTVEVTCTDNSVHKLRGLFAKHILAALHNSDAD